MKKKIFFQILFTLSFFQFSYGQDTIRVMTYNLLNFGNNNNACNLITCKIPSLRTIVSTIKPTVIGCQEMTLSNTAFRTQQILDSVLNINGVSSWKKSLVYNGDAICNVLFYDSDKIGLKNEYLVQTGKRLNIYDLYYYNNTTNDTIPFRVVNVHLKAGETTADAEIRRQEVISVRARLEELSSSSATNNTIILGDFNVYSSDAPKEPCYPLLTNPTDPTIKFIDPIGKPGEWNRSVNFALYHTQSTRDVNLGDGGSEGGLDSRFDQILCFENIMNGVRKMLYLEDSYHTLGQNGKCYNKDLVDCTENSEIPMSLKSTLRKMSDHLPVYADFVMQTSTSSRVSNASPKHRTYLAQNPVQEYVTISTTQIQPTFEVMDVQGRNILLSFEQGANDTFRANVADLPAGVYLLKTYSPTTYPKVLKFIKN